MINIDSLPKVISINGDWYELNLHITFKTRMCVSYKFAGGPKRAIKLKKEYNVLSQVVEPDMTSPVVTSDDIYDIVDVPNAEKAWEVLEKRVNEAITNNKVTVVFNN